MERHLALGNIDVADVGAGLGTDKELAVDAHVDAVVVAVGDGNFGGRIVVIGILHGGQVDEVERAAIGCGGGSRRGD
jgi:hypothetical protein